MPIPSFSLLHIEKLGMGLGTRLCLSISYTWTISSCYYTAPFFLFSGMLTLRVNRRTCSLQLQSYMVEFGGAYPWTIGKSVCNLW